MKRKKDFCTSFLEMEAGRENGAIMKRNKKIIIASK